MILWEFVKNKMQANLQQEICENDAVMSFEEMIVFAESFAKKLKGCRCCAILCRSEMAAAMALLSCFAAEVTALPLSEQYGEKHCQKIIEAIGPDAIITDTYGELQVMHMSDSWYHEPLIHPALVMCTSGTTGVPKGAMLTETNVITNVSDIVAYFTLNSSDHILIARPLYHCAVLTGELLTALVKGCKIRFYSGPFNPMIILNLIKKYNVTAFCGTPTLLSIMSRLRREHNQYPLKHICISGECMGRETGIAIAAAFPQANIYHVYGLTEACPRVAYLPPEKFKENADCVGVPLRSVSLVVLSNEGNPVLKNEVGILWVKGDNVMAGYYNNPEKTSEVLKDGWLCTGDLAMFNENGYLKIMGRNDDLIIKAGMNIYPAEVEGALKADPRVRELYVCGEKDENMGMQVALHIAGAFLDVTEVKAMCQSLLPHYQLPAKIYLVEELPKNGSGKILRH